MSRPPAGSRRLLPAAALLLLLAGPAAAAAADAPVPAPAPGQIGCGGCARSGAADAAPRCGRAAAGGCCGAMRGSRHGRHGHGGAMGRRSGGGAAEVMRTVRTLVHDHRQQIERTVELVDNGVVTVTRAPASEEAAAAIRRHVLEVQQLLADGGRVRMWDPLFRELLAHAEEISLEVEELPDGMRVTETSESPSVVALIQAHARKVSEFIARGPDAVHEETPLPAGYAPPVAP